MKKFLFIITFLVLLGVFSLADTEVIKLNDNIMKPDQIVAGDGFIYITEGTSISVFSGKDFKFISKFGKKGEGPGEIQGSRRGNVRFTLMPVGEKLFLFNRNKVMYFSKEGRFLKDERKFQTGFVRDFLPVGQYFVGRSISGFTRGRGRRNANDIKSSLNIYDKNLKKIKSFYPELKSIGFGSFLSVYSPESIFFLKTGNDKIYIADTMKMNIKIFDKNGKKVNLINYNYKNGDVPTSKKDEIHNYFKTSQRFKAFYDRIKNRISVGKVYPAIKDFFIDKNMILIQTYNDTKNGTEFYLFDNSGKFIKKTILPIQKLNILEFYPFSIRNGTLYQIVENEDEEEWELHISKI